MGIEPQGHRRSRRTHPSQPERFGAHEAPSTAADAVGMVCRRHPQRRPGGAQQSHHLSGERPAQTSGVGATDHSGLSASCGESASFGHHGRARRGQEHFHRGFGRASLQQRPKTGGVGHRPVEPTLQRQYLGRQNPYGNTLRASQRLHPSLGLGGHFGRRGKKNQGNDYPL